MTEPGRPGTKCESHGTLPGGLAAAQLAPSGPDSAVSCPSCDEKTELRWAALNRRMDSLLERMQGPHTHVSPRERELVRQPQPPPPPPPTPEEEPAEVPASAERLPCPRCSGKVYPSAPHGLFELFLKLFGSGPLRCHACYYRFGEFMGLRFILRN